MQTQSSTQQTRFEEYICRIACSNGWSWNSLNNPEFSEMIAEIRPDLKVPNWHALGGRLLESEVMNVETELKNHVQAGLATGMCDGWKNVSKTLLVASMAMVDYQAHITHIHDVSADRKTADNLLQIILGEIEYMENNYVSCQS
ncbi:hypothetical protein FRC11_002196, partial [Ceratobasidium sp. 423]